MGAHECVNTACVMCVRAALHSCWLQRVRQHSTLPDISKGERADGSNEHCFERIFLLKAKLCLYADFARGPGGGVYWPLVRPDGWFPVGFSILLRGMVGRNT